MGSPVHPLPLLSLLVVVSRELSFPCSLEERELQLGGGKALPTDTWEERGGVCGGCIHLSTPRWRLPRGGSCGCPTPGVCTQ